MVVQCPSCLTKFSVDASLFAKFSNPRFHCTRCGHYFASNSGLPSHVGSASSSSSSKHGSPAKIRRIVSATDEAEQLELLPKAPPKGAPPKKHRRVERSGEHTPSPVGDEDISVTAQWNDDQGQIQYEADLGQIHSVEAEVVSPAPGRSFAAGIASRIAAAAQAPAALAQRALTHKTLEHRETFEYKEYRERPRPLDPSSESLRDSGIELFEPQNPFVDPTSSDLHAESSPTERRFGPSASVVNEGIAQAAAEDRLPVAEWNTPEFDSGTTEYISPFQTPFQSASSPNSEHELAADDSALESSFNDSSFSGLGAPGEHSISAGYTPGTSFEDSASSYPSTPNSSDRYYFDSPVETSSQSQVGLNIESNSLSVSDLDRGSDSSYPISSPDFDSSYSSSDQLKSSSARSPDLDQSLKSETDWALEPTATSGTGNWNSQPWSSTTGASQSSARSDDPGYDGRGGYSRSSDQIDPSRYAVQDDLVSDGGAIESFQRIAASAVAGAKARTAGKQLAPIFVNPVLAAAGRSALSVSVPIVALTVFLRLSGFFGGYGGIGTSGEAPLRFFTSVGESSLPHAAPLGMELTDIRPEVVSLDNGEEVMQITGNVVNTTRRKISEAIIEAKTFSNSVEPLEMVEVNFSNGLTNAARLGALGAPSLLELQTHQGIKEARLNPNERAPFKLVIPTTAGKAAWYSARIARVRYEDS